MLLFPFVLDKHTQARQMQWYSIEHISLTTLIHISTSHTLRYGSTPSRATSETCCCEPHDRMDMISLGLVIG